jgi:hypothetical protein
MALVFGGLLKNALINSGTKMIMPITKVEYVESWAQK